MTEAGCTGNKVTAECIRDTLSEQGNVLSPHVVAQCIDDLLKTDSYQQGWVAGLQFAAKQAGIGAQLWEAGMKDREAAALLEFQGWLLKKAQDEKGGGDGLHTDSTENC